MYDRGFDRLIKEQNREKLEENKEELAREIASELDRWRPENRDFDDVYSIAKMTSDDYAVEKYLGRKKAKHGKDNEEEETRLRDGLELEGVFCRVDEIELFEETSDDARYDYLFTEDEDFALQAFPAHKYDDIFNNTDITRVFKDLFHSIQLFSCGFC